MDVIHCLAKLEPCAERVRAWVEQCNFTHRNLEYEAENLEVDFGSHQESYSEEFGIRSSPEEEEREKNWKTRVVPLSSKPKGSIISYRSCLSNSSSGRIYSTEESEEIINYIVKNDKFVFIKGNVLWQEMETNKVCNRSWQSMKSQFISKIYPKINSYYMQPEDRQKFHHYMKSSKSKSLHMEPGERGWRKNGHYYTELEDLAILKYVLQKHRYFHVLGNSLWQAMEDKKVLPGRSWQSMRTRFLKTIRHSLTEYDIPESSIKKLRIGRDMNNKEKLNLSSLHSPRSDQRSMWEKKEQQNIRKIAVGASIKLASDMKKLKDVQQTAKKIEKKIHFLPVLDSKIRSEEINMDIENNSLKRNLNINNNNNIIPDEEIQSAGNNSGLINSDCTNNMSGENTQTHPQDNSPKTPIHSFDSCETLTQSCIHKNSLIGNINCAACNSGETVQTCDEPSSPFMNLKFTNDSCGRESQGCVEDNSLVFNSNSAIWVEKLGTHLKESSPMRNLIGTFDSSENVTQICIQNNSSLGNLSCVSDNSGENVQMFDEESSPNRNSKTACASSWNETQTCIENNSPMVNPNTALSVKKLVSHTEKSSSTRNLAGTFDSSDNVIEMCVQNNCSIENSNCISDNFRGNAQMFDEENSPIRHLKIICDSSWRGTQKSVEYYTPVVDVSKVVEDSSEMKTQECIENISCQRNSESDSDTFNNVVQICFKNNFSVQDSKDSDYSCVNEIQDCVGKDSLQINSGMNENINLAFMNEEINMNTNFDSSSMKIAVRTERVNQNCNDMNMMSSETEEKTLSNFIGGEDEVSEEKSDKQDSICSSLFSQETVILHDSDCINHLANTNCEKCFVGHLTLSPSSN